MKKSNMFVITFVLVLLSTYSISAAACDIEVSMINQDPYPAIPGDYVKVVFQIDGIENPECGQVEFELIPKYPISLDPTQSAKVSINSGTYSKDYSSYLLAPYKVRVDEAALNGDNPIEVKYKFAGNQGLETKQFNLNVKDVRADFEIHVKSYDSLTGSIVFEILNIGKEDIQALSVEIVKQENIEVKGSKVNIVGDLDSNEYTTADFEAIPKSGNLNLKLSYTDSTGTRRTTEELVLYEPEYFEGSDSSSGSSIWTYVIWAVAIIAILYYFYRRNQKKKLMKARH